MKEDPHVLLGRVIDASTDLCHAALANNSARVAHLEELLWNLYEGIYGHRKAEGIDPFKTAVGGALDVHKAWKERGSTKFKAVGWWDGKQALWEPDKQPVAGALLFRPEPPAAESGK